MVNTDLTTVCGSLSTQANPTPVIDFFAKSQDVADTSRELYRRTVTGFFDWVTSTGRTISALTLADVIAYKDELLKGGKSSLTVASYVNSIRRFYTWAEANKIYPNIAHGVHAPKRKQEFRKRPLSVAKVGELLRYEQTTNPRDYAIINLMARTGLRCVEVVRANIEDITYIGEHRVLMVQGKGHTEKDDFVQLPDAAFNPIRDYLNTRKGEPKTAPLFTSTSNHTAKDTTDGTDKDYNPRRLTTRTVSAIAKKGLQSVGLDDKVFTAHSLRHTAGTNILRAGGTIEQAQYMLRHTNPATTQIYTATIRNERRLENGGETLLDKLYNTTTV